MPSSPDDAMASHRRIEGNYLTAGANPVRTDACWKTTRRETGKTSRSPSRPTLRRKTELAVNLYRLVAIGVDGDGRSRGDKNISQDGQIILSPYQTRSRPFCYNTSPPPAWRFSTRASTKSKSDKRLTYCRGCALSSSARPSATIARSARRQTLMTAYRYAGPVHFCEYAFYQAAEALEIAGSVHRPW